MQLDAAPGLMTVGDPSQTREALRLVLGHVAGGDPQRHLLIQGSVDGGEAPSVRLWVCDPTAPPASARQEGRWRRRPDRRDAAVAIEVATRLLRHQGGDLSAQPGADGRGGVAMSLPAASRE